MIILAVLEVGPASSSVTGMLLTNGNGNVAPILEHNPAADI
ncbi:hypothetical protein QWA68_016857, partial [Fusarium oxysporum]